MFLIQNSSYLNKASIVKHPVEKFRENEQQEEGFSYGTFSVHIRLQTSHTTCLMLLLLLATLRCYDRILPLWSRETRGCSVHEPNCNSCQGLNWRGANIYLLASSPPFPSKTNAYHSVVRILLYNKCTQFYKFLKILQVFETLLARSDMTALFNIIEIFKHY